MRDVRAPWILMCPPQFYGIEYEINPWMDRRKPVVQKTAVAQWEALRAIFIELGVTVSELEPQPGMPDLVFTANAGLVYQQQIVPSRFRYEQRQLEEPLNERWFTEQGYRLIQIAKDPFFEGAGDALFCGETLFAGYRMRSDAGGLQKIGEQLGVRVLPLELVDGFYYHLDTCFCPLAPGVAIYYPGAFDRYGQKALEEHVETLVAVEKEEAESFACNAVVIGKNVVTNTGCPKLHARLKSLGYHPIETPLSEFVKAGGSAKCLTLRLDGEEAAAWKSPTVQ